MKPPPSEIFTIRLASSDRRALDRAAAADHRTVSALVRAIIAEWLRKRPDRKRT